MLEIISVDIPEIVRREIHEMQTRGWIEVDEAVSLVDGLFSSPMEVSSKRKSVEEWFHELCTTPVSLDNTILGNTEVKGVMLSGQPTKGGHTGLTRLLVHPELGRIAFIENEWTFTGERTHIHCEELRDRFNGRPVVYVVAKTPVGSATTTFLWSTESREFQLYIDLAIFKRDPWYRRIENGLMQPLS